MINSTPNYFPYPQIEVLFTEKCNLNCSYCFEKNKKNSSFNKEDLELLVDTFYSKEFYFFGGEPLLEIELVTDLIDILEKKKFDEATKNKMIHSCKFHITNGTLIEKNLEIIKKYNLVLQISLDGPKNVNDKNRVYHNKKGSFDDVLNGINICNNNDISYTIHGAIGRNSFQDLFDVFKFFFDIETQYRGIDFAIHNLGVNFLQIVFEDDYTDADVDIFLQQFLKISTWIWDNTEYEMSDDQRKRAYINWCARRGSSCIAGNKLIAVTSDFEIYPCHRLALLDNKEKFSLLNLKDSNREFKNYELFNSFLFLNQTKTMIGTHTDIVNWQGNLSWMNWCPASNVENGISSIFYIKPKYNVLIAELNEMILELNEFYGISQEEFDSKKFEKGSCMNENIQVIND